MKVNILISTLNEGIERVKDVVLKSSEGISYIIVHQFTNEEMDYTPESLLREDIKISKLKGKGLTKSRNHAIDLADGDIGLLCDDDVVYNNSNFELLKQTFKENKDVDLAIFKIRTPEGEPEYSNFPDHKIKYKQKAPSVGSVQIAFRIKKIKEKGLRFDERFGAGQDLLIGSEERIFVHDCIAKGLNVAYFPEYIVEHPYESTVKSISKYDKRRIWVTGGLDCRINGPVALVKAFMGTLKYAPDLIRHRVNPFFYLYHRVSAVFYILRTNKEKLV